MEIGSIIKKARKVAQKHWYEYQEEISVSKITKEVASLMQEYTQKGGVRPFGVSVLIVGFDENIPRIYQVDPSGAYWTWKATALGKNMGSVKTFLEKRWKEKT